ncbi:unnamed protein product [Nippostrongylus brasiliensis]|uniref:DB domain-containing protein n=1 Tax=Nippostrongylus brasiliensis TaxID=27835 RepID=A0A0N4XUV4_NIPBR|nr:unnamed protein product [Nippostrongylus brasiliensis]
MFNRIATLSLIIVAVTVDLGSACFASGVCGGGCAPPPPAPVCGGGCGGGYSCGQYGCYRARARAASARTLSINGREKKPTTPDEKFMACCVDRNLPDSCLNKCSFRTYTKAALQFCAAQGQDHRDCCARNGVATTLAGYKNMKACFWHNLSQEPETAPTPAAEPEFQQPEESFSNDEQIQSFPEDHIPRVSLRVPGSARTFQAKTFN